MGLIDIVRRYLGPTPPRSDFEDTVPIGQSSSGAVQSYVQSYSYTGEAITPARALESPSVYACVRLIASSIASLPWDVLQETDDGKIAENNHPLYSLLNYEVNEDVGALQWREKVISDVLLTGNHYSYIYRDATGRPVSLEPLRPDYVAVYRDGQNQPYYQVWTGKYTGSNAEKAMRRFRAYDMFHVVGATTFDGVLGVPPIHLMRDVIALELEITEFITRFISNNAVPAGTLKMPGRLSPDASKRLREAWQAAHGGASRAGRVAVLEDGLEYKPITNSMKDNDLIEMRKYCRQQIAAMFQVPAHKIGDTDSTSYNAAEQSDSQFVKHALASWASRLEQEAARKLIMRGEPYCTRINFDSLLRADMSTRFGAYAVGITNGVLTVNEARAREGLKAVDGGDQIRVPLNTATPGFQQPTAPSVPPSEDLEPEEVEEVPASVDIDAEDAEEQTERARELLAAAHRTAAIAAVRPAVEGAYKRHLTRVSEYLLKQRTQAKLDKWAPPIDCLDADLRDVVAGLGRLLGDEAKAVKVLDEALVRHARHLRRSVGEIGHLSDSLAGWNTLPGSAATELLDLVRIEVLNEPILEDNNAQA
jgi:HK97 family phage portal protein